MSPIWLVRAGYGVGVILIALGVGLVFEPGWAVMVIGVGCIAYALLIHDVDEPSQAPDQ